MTTDQSARERAQETAGTAAQESKHVAGTAKDEAQRVASEATSQARSVVSDALGQVTEQSSVQKDRLASTLSTLGEDLDSMAGRGTPGLAADLAREVSSQVSNLGAHLQSREPQELLDDVRRFARQRPGTFLLGALAAGVVVGRLARGTADGIAAAEGTATPATPSARPAHAAGTTPVPSASTATASPVDTPVATPVVPPTPVPAVPAEPPMATTEAGYGERGVSGFDEPDPDAGGLR